MNFQQAVIFTKNSDVHLLDDWFLLVRPPMLSQENSLFFHKNAYFKIQFFYNGLSNALLQMLENHVVIYALSNKHLIVISAFKCRTKPYLIRIWKGIFQNVHLQCISYQLVLINWIWFSYQLFIFLENILHRSLLSTLNLSV